MDDAKRPTRKRRELGPHEERVDEICGWYTVNGAAKRMGVNPRALDTYIDRNRILCKVIGPTRLVTMESLKPYAEMVERRIREAIEQLDQMWHAGDED